MEYTEPEIREILLECDYPLSGTLLDDTVKRICCLGSEAAKMFSEWHKSGRTPHFEINGITSDFLILTYKMKAPALIIAYDWLLKEPDEASRLLKKQI